ncbi:MAG TPA: hypothetical protein PKA13_04455 [Geminicoccaceae bacterium]|nr:hypothetical protein [Geminicoccus sp.]HMU49001.1 hypothetical protein [Geminicoccaceae bacterium]
MRILALSILLLLLSFAFLAAAPAQALDLQATRTIGFPLTVAALATVAAGWRPAVPAPHDAAPLILLGLLAVMAIVEMPRGLDPMGYKLALPIAALLAAPRIALLLDGVDVARAVRALLAIYVTITALAVWWNGAGGLVRGYDGIERLDVTGSVVTHASLCAVHVVLAIGTLLHGRRWSEAPVAVATGLAALAMIFLSGTRTALVTWGLFMALSLAGGRRRLGEMLALTGGLATALVLHTALVSDSFALRLQGGQDAYGSGRSHSIAAWLGRLVDEPLGIGLGTIRRELAIERPAIDGERMLEWPHNEVVRLTVEGGPLGLVLILGLLACTARMALRGARAATDPLRRDLLLVLVADVIAESMLQNFFNGIYQATAFLLLIGILATPLSARPQPG